MSYKIQGTDLIISGFQDGIADSPYEGIGDMRNMDIIGVPGEASTSYKLASLTIPPALNAIAFTVLASNDTFTWVGATPSMYNGCAIVLNTLVGGTGLALNKVFYVEVLTATTFKVHLRPNLSDTAVNVTLDGSGTFTTYQYGNQRGIGSYAPISYFVDTNGSFSGGNGVVLVDASNYAWVFIVSNQSNIASYNLVFLGNIGGIGATSFSQNGVSIWNGYLLLFGLNEIDVAKVSDLWSGTGPLAAWGVSGSGYSWKTTAVNSTVQSRINTLVSQEDGNLYYTGTSSGSINGIGSIIKTPGSTFDPTSSGTYTATVNAIGLPSNDGPTCLGELGAFLYIGGRNAFVYVWDKLSLGFNSIITFPDIFSTNIVCTNQSTYVFMGNRGKIYITNGSAVDEFKKVSDYVTGIVNPNIIFTDASYLRNQLYFAFEAYNNAGTLLTSVNGAWAIDLKSNALRMVNKVSNSGYSGQSYMVAPLPLSGNSFPATNMKGTGLVVGWTVSTTFGVDVGSGNLYDSYESYIDTDIVPVGTFLSRFTPTQIEWKTSVPLGANGTVESIRISYRTNIFDSFTVVGTTTATGTSVVGSTTGTTTGNYAVSDYYTANFQNTQWVQFRIEESSNATTPTNCRLTEIRIRDIKNK